MTLYMQLIILHHVFSLARTWSIAWQRTECPSHLPPPLVNARKSGLTSLCKLMGTVKTGLTVGIGQKWLWIFLEDSAGIMVQIVQLGPTLTWCLPWCCDQGEYVCHVLPFFFIAFGFSHAYFHALWNRFLQKITLCWYAILHPVSIQQFHICFDPLSRLQSCWWSLVKTLPSSDTIASWFQI